LRLTSSSDAINRSEAASLTVNLLFLSNLIPSKGVYVLLDACKMLKDRGVAFQCNFVGGESKEMDRRVFEEAVKERGLEGCVLYHGPKYGEEKEQYWRMADVFVFPTFYHNETFGLVIVEAMQYRLPIVSTDEGGIPDVVIDGQNGFICKRKDAVSLANAIERLIVDEALRNTMGEEGYRIYQEKFTLSCFENKFTEILRKMNG
jgi:glycosyltransferase involved in cell wall biosynthesis